jgi:hypothetical protein
MNRKFDPAKVMDVARISPNNSRIQILPGDNWLVVGRKGSGKTTAGKMLTEPLMKLYPTHRLYVFDGKMRDFNNYPGIVAGDDLPPKLTGNQRVQVWQPTIIKPDVVEEWLFRVRQDAPAILQVDELLFLCYGQNGSEELTRITKLGRGLPILSIIHTQELVQIPRGVITQPDHVIRMRLKSRWERRLMDNFLNVEEDSKLPEPADKYGLWYGHADKDGAPQYYPSIQNFLGLPEKSRV